MHKQPPNISQARRATQQGRYELSANDFQKISALIYQRAGIVLAAHKQEMVYNRLLRRVRARNLVNF